MGIPDEDRLERLSTADVGNDRHRTVKKSYKHTKSVKHEVRNLLDFPRLNLFANRSHTTPFNIDATIQVSSVKFCVEVVTDTIVR